MCSIVKNFFEIVFTRVCTICSEMPDQDDLGQSVLNVKARFEDRLNRMKIDFKRELYLEFRVRSNSEFKAFLEQKIEKDGSKAPSENQTAESSQSNRKFSEKIGNNPLLLKTVANSFKFVAKLPQDIFSPRLLKIPLKFLFKFKMGPSDGPKLQPVEIKADRLTESHRRYKHVMVKSGLNRVLRAEDLQSQTRLGIYEIENGTSQYNKRLRQLSVIAAFVMTLAVLYSKD